MSLTNSRRVPGSSTRFIIRAATPPMSGSNANSRSLTWITPSVAAIGAGKGSAVWPGGSGAGCPCWASAPGAISNPTNTTRVM